jgi:WD40 repeat protein
VIEGANDFAWSPDGKSIAVTTIDGVYLLDAQDLLTVAFRATDYIQRKLAFSNDGSTLVTADHWQKGRQLHGWDAITLESLWNHDLPWENRLGGADEHAQAMALAPLPDGDVLLAVSQVPGTEVWLVDPSGPMHRLLEVPYSQPLTVALQPLRRWMAVAMVPYVADEAGAVQVWDLATQSLLGKVPAASGLSLQFVHYGSILLVGDWYAYAWDVERNEAVTSVTLDTGALGSPGVPSRFAVSQDDTLFATGTLVPDVGIGIWEIATGQLVGLMPHPDLGHIRNLSFSPISNDIAIFLSDGRLQVWQTDL